MRLLPILWGKTPRQSDWVALSRAKDTFGYSDMVQPATALQGSPGRILAIGRRPDWLCEYNYVDDTADPRLPGVLQWCLDDTITDPQAPTYADMLSHWFGGTVTFSGEEPHDA